MGQALAHTRVVGLAVGLGHLGDALQLLLEAAVAGGGRGPPLEAEGGHGHLPAAVDAADHVLLRAAGVGEEDLVELRRGVDLLDGADLDARLLHGAEQVRDALVLRGVRVGAGQHEDVVGEAGLGGPDLLAVDDPLVAVQLGLGLEPGEVGAGIGLGEALAPGDLPAEDLGDELLLLLLGPPLQDRGADEGVAEEVGPHRGAGAVELLGQDDGVHRGQAPAAVLGSGHEAHSQLPSCSLAVHPRLNALRSSGVISNPSSNQPSGRFSSSHERTSSRNSSASGGIGQVHGGELDQSVRYLPPQAVDPRRAAPPPSSSGVGCRA